MPVSKARAQLMQYQASLDSARATLMSFLGWNSLNAISNDFPQKLARSCDIAEPDDRLVPRCLPPGRRPTSPGQPRLRRRADDADRLAGAGGAPLSERSLRGQRHADRTQYSAWVKVQMPLYQGGGLTARRNAAGHAVEAAQSTIPAHAP
jgi:adhesin transport system outer membrane protein